MTLGTGVYLTWRQAPSLYQSAQRVDHNLKLADALSTALHFWTHREISTELRLAQWEQAEQLAARVNPRDAIPFRAPRALYGTAVVALIAASLCAVRYGIERRLDLRAPLLRLVQERFITPESRQDAQDRRDPLRRENKASETPGVLPGDTQQQNPGELDPATDAALDTVGVPEVENKSSSGRPENSKLAQTTQLENEETESQDPEGISANSGNQQSADGKQGPGASKQGQSGEQQNAGSSSENSGLLGKFRDAMSSLLNRMRQPSGAKPGPQQAGAQNGQQKGAQGNNGQAGQQSRQPGDGQRADAKDGQPGQDGQNAQNGQSGSPGESGQQPATHQPGSGIGRQDGNKDVQLAEQLAAMGKISEIIGKRAANVTGEVTVEVQNSNQQLRTPYARSSAEHGQAGGEINRDEVPLAFQAYVQQYFEQVRKQAITPQPRHRAERQAANPGSN